MSLRARGELVRREMAVERDDGESHFGCVCGCAGDGDDDDVGDGSGESGLLEVGEGESW